LRKKNRKRRTARLNWHEELKSTGMTPEEVKEMAEITSEVIEDRKLEVGRLRKQLSHLQNTQLLASHQSKQLLTRDSYEELYKARIEVRKARSLLMPLEEELRSLRQESYYWNNVARYGKSSQRSDSRIGKSAPTVATWSHYSVEDFTELLDVSILTNSRGKRRQVVFSGTDYGVCTMSETMPQTLDEINEHINRYQVLGNDICLYSFPTFK
jgi:hypothetical protein